MIDKIEIYTDGGARGNPGPAGIGAVIKRKAKSEKRKIIKEIAEYIGRATNNQAEYRAIIKALEWIKSQIANSKSQITSKFYINCYLDSKLVVEQVNDRYKIKNEGLKPLYDRVRELIIELGGNVSFKHIPREKNKEADALVNKAIDTGIGDRSQ